MSSKFIFGEIFFEFMSTMLLEELAFVFLSSGKGNNFEKLLQLHFPLFNKPECYTKSVLTFIHISLMDLAESFVIPN
jgi:hypothetical protein